MIFELTEKRLEQAMQALGDLKRLRLLEFIATGTLLPMTEMAGLLGMNPTNCNFHLKKLENSELINRHTSGRYVYYSLNRDMLQKLSNFLIFPEPQNETKRSEEESSENPPLRPTGDREDSSSSDDGRGNGVSGCG